MREYIVVQKNEYVIEPNKTIESLEKDELIALVYQYFNEIRTINAEKNAIIDTMNKFLAKDHAETLQKVLVQQNQSDRWGQ